MRYFTALFLLSSVLSAQKEVSKYFLPSYELIYSQKFLKYPVFAQDTSMDLNFNAPISSIGIGRTDFLLISRGFWDHPGSLFYTQILPRKIKINDSTSANMTGFTFGFSIYGVDIFKKQKKLDLLLNFGANTGRLRLYGNDKVKQKNPFFSPKLSMTPRFFIGKVAVQACVSYEIDISSKNWRKTQFSGPQKMSLNRTSNTGLTISAGIGILVNNDKKKNKNTDI